MCLDDLPIERQLCCHASPSIPKAEPCQTRAVALYPSVVHTPVSTFVAAAPVVLLLAARLTQSLSPPPIGHLALEPPGSQLITAAVRAAELHQ
eukprot:710478-Pelagomonas_calceolata.AAC.2